MAQVQKSQKQVDLAIKVADGAFEGWKRKHVTRGYDRARKRVGLSVKIASCNEKCGFVDFKSDGEKVIKGACVSENQRIEPDHSITIIVVDKAGQGVDYLRAFFGR